MKSSRPTRSPGLRLAADIGGTFTDVAAFDERTGRPAIKRYSDDMHALRYGTSAPGEPAEIVSLRSTVAGVVRKPMQAKIARGGLAPPQAAFTGRRAVYFHGRGFVRRGPFPAPRSPPATASRVRR
jgi:N-methylhydantoinase A/oxoprolinase/acetone carboxylase beta subunit